MLMKVEKMGRDIGYKKKESDKKKKKDNKEK